jgi:hypothetical protein
MFKCVHDFPQRKTLDDGKGPSRKESQIGKEEPSGSRDLLDAVPVDEKEEGGSQPDQKGDQLILLDHGLSLL